MALQLLDVFLALTLTFTMMCRVLAASSADQLVAAVWAGSGLVCVKNGDLFQGVAEAATLFRDPSIDTINYLQRDFIAESSLVEGGKMTLGENHRDPATRMVFLSSSSASAHPPLKTRERDGPGAPLRRYPGLPRRYRRRHGFHAIQPLTLNPEMDLRPMVAHFQSIFQFLGIESHVFWIVPIPESWRFPTCK